MRPKTVIAICATVVLLYACAVVGVYVGHLGELPFSKTDPAPWGQFGDYLGGLLNPVFALVNVLVVLYIAASLQRLNESERQQVERSEQQIKTVMQLHREWNGEAIYRSRIIAGKLVRKHPTSTLFEIEVEEPYDDAAHIWVVVGFFQRLGFLVLHEKVDEKMTIDLFAELFVWWWVISYERQLSPCKCDASDQVLVLKSWFFDKTSDEQREPWVQRAKRDLAAAEEQANAVPLYVL